MSKLFTALENQYAVHAEQGINALDAEIVKTDAEIDEESTVINRMHSDEKTAYDAIDELESIREVTACALNNDEGLSEDAAKIAAIATENICARLGYTPSKRIVPSTESFSTLLTREEATKYALEGLGSMLSTVWKAIKDFFVSLLAKIKNLWKSLTSKKVLTEKKITVLEKTLNEYIHAGYVQDDNADKADRSKYIVPFSVQKGETVVQGISRTIKTHTNAKNYKKDISATVEKFIKILETTDKEKILNAVRSSDAVDFGDFSALYGNQKEVQQSIETNKEGLRKLSINIEKSDLAFESKIEGTSTLDELKDIIVQTKELTDASVSSYSFYEETVSAIAKELKKLHGDLSSNHEPEDSPSMNERDYAALLLTELNNIKELVKVVNFELPLIGSIVASSALSYVNDNLKSYKKP